MNEIKKKYSKKLRELRMNELKENSVELNKFAATWSAVDADGLKTDTSESEERKSIRMQTDSQQNFMPLIVGSPCSCHGWPPPLPEFTMNEALPMIEGPNPAHSGFSNIFGWLSPKNLPHRTPILVKHVGIYGAEEHPVVYMGFCTMEDGVNVLLLTHPTKPSAKLWGEEIQKIIGWKALPQ